MEKYIHIWCNSWSDCPDILKNINKFICVGYGDFELEIYKYPKSSGASFIDVKKLLPKKREISPALLEWQISQITKGNPEIIKDNPEILINEIFHIHFDFGRKRDVDPESINIYNEIPWNELIIDESCKIIELLNRKLKPFNWLLCEYVKNILNYEIFILDGNEAIVLIECNKYYYYFDRRNS
jgi:hypothetical protein